MKNQSNNELTKRSQNRIKRRLSSNEQKQNQKKERQNNYEREMLIQTQFRDILKKHKNTEKKVPKRLETEKLISLFAFLPQGQFDKRHISAVRKEWKCHSFNTKRQTMDFFRTFIYPYPIPEPLVFTSIQEDLFEDEYGELRYSQDFAVIQKGRKWISDIVSGGSFYKKNKDCFTKTEAHYFLSSKVSYNDNSSLIAMYFEAKCKARSLGQSLCAVVTTVFTVKFLHTYNCPIVKGFIDLLARHSDCRLTADELGDICDFVNTKITKYQQSFVKSEPFSFNGRTIASVVSLANEWHTQHQREIRLLNRLGYNSRQITQIPEKWDGLGVNNFRYENDNHLWTIRQLCSVNEIINEGRRMKHCVASYAYRCSNYRCSIFNVSSFNRSTNTTESVATIEISSHYEIVQIKGKCNTKVGAKVMNVVSRWAQQERLKFNSIISY